MKRRKKAKHLLESVYAKQELLRRDMMNRKKILRCVGIAFLIGVVVYIGSNVLSRDGFAAISCGSNVFLREIIIVLGLAIVLGILCRKCS